MSETIAPPAKEPTDLPALLMAISSETASRFCPMRLVIFGVILLMASTGWCQAELTWQKTRVEATAPLEQERLETSFLFKNTGDRPVTILSVNTSCGCTTATLEKQTYEPGETGEIKTTFSFEGRTGNQEKTIQVATSDKSDPTTLVLRVTILEAFTIKPRILLWKKGDSDITSKSAFFTANRKAAVIPSDVRCDSPLFDVMMIPLEHGQRYELQVTPKSALSAGKGAIRIDIESAPGVRTTTVVYAVIQ